MRDRIRQAGLWALAAIPLALGWIAGVTVKAAKLFKAALLEGYERGSQL